MDSIGSILKRLREENNLTGKEAVEKLKEFGIDISAKTLYGYESGRNSTNADMFLALCKIYKCQNVMSIFSDSTDEVLFTNKEWEMVEKYRLISTHSPDGASVVDTVLDREYAIAGKLKEQEDQLQKAEVTETAVSTRIINYYYRLASAGTGQIIFDTPPTKRIEIPDIPAYRKADYAIGVNGNSMEPLYHDGDMLLIEMTEDINIGDIGIFRVDNESYVKKLGETELVSLNPDAKNIPLNESAGCMGKVIGKLTND